MIKARSSTGITVTEYHGSFGLKEAADFEISGIDADKTLSFQIRNDEKLKENQFAFVQFAMLYATQFGERRIRVFNLNLPIAKNLNEYYKKADVEGLSFYIIRKELSRA
jgi:protein transport protein SEC24